MASGSSPRTRKAGPGYADPEHPTAAELRSYLRGKLPEPMVPSDVVLLDRLPLTPNGKVDRRRLPAPDYAGPEHSESFTQPRTPVEEIMAEVWATVLGLDKVGVHDNFFELGGHSLLATQVMSRLHDAFQVDLPLRALFEAPTVAQLESGNLLLAYVLVKRVRTDSQVLRSLANVHDFPRVGHSFQTLSADLKPLATGLSSEELLAQNAFE